MKTNFRPTGFTLLEVLIATGAFMIVMVVAVSIFGLTVGSSSATDQLRLNTQAARLAIESISREARLAKGLVYVDNEDPHMVVPPFTVGQELLSNGESTWKIKIYQVKKTSLSAAGDQLYSVSRRTYYLDFNSVLRLEIQNGDVAATNKTAQELYALATTNGIPFGAATSDSILPAGLGCDQLKVINFQAYPAPNASLTTLTSQPYFELDLTVINARFNSYHDNNKQIRTTLRTMIVPRNFVNPFEVVQPGVQPPGQE